jgi:Helix-turn-helix.
MKTKENVLKILRKKRGLTQEEVADKIGATKITISRYESNQRKIGGENLVKLAKLFNVTPEYILSGKEESITISQDKLTKANMSFFKSDNISDEDKKEMLDLLNEFYFKQKLEKERK